MKENAKAAYYEWKSLKQDKKKALKSKKDFSLQELEKLAESIEKSRDDLALVDLQPIHNTVGERAIDTMRRKTRSTGPKPRG